MIACGRICLHDASGQRMGTCLVSFTTNWTCASRHALQKAWKQAGEVKSRSPRLSSSSLSFWEADGKSSKQIKHGFVEDFALGAGRVDMVLSFVALAILLPSRVLRMLQNLCC